MTCHENIHEMESHCVVVRKIYLSVFNRKKLIFRKAFRVTNKYFARQAFIVIH